METLEGALQKAPQNPLCKFERASILFSVERFDEALVELKQLKVLVPKESPVYFLMGKVCIKSMYLPLINQPVCWLIFKDFSRQ